MVVQVVHCSNSSHRLKPGLGECVEVFRHVRTIEACIRFAGNASFRLQSLRAASQEHSLLVEAVVTQFGPSEGRGGWSPVVSVKVELALGMHEVLPSRAP